MSVLLICKRQDCNVVAYIHAALTLLFMCGFLVIQLNLCNVSINAHDTISKLRTAYASTVTQSNQHSQSNQTAFTVVDSTHNISIDFPQLSKWISVHPNGAKFSMDDFTSSTARYDRKSVEVRDDIMHRWHKRAIVRLLDKPQLMAIENHCIRKWKQLIQDKFSSVDKYIGEYVLKQGNKIGAMRHFGLVPWDDDFDILFYIKHRQYQNETLELFDSIAEHPLYGRCSLVYKECGFGKVYFNNLDTTLEVQGFQNKRPDVWLMKHSHLSTGEMRYPLIDIFFGYLDAYDEDTVLYTQCSIIADTSDKSANRAFNDTFPVQYLPVDDQYYPFERSVLWDLYKGIAGEYGEDNPMDTCIIERIGLYTHGLDTNWAYTDPVQCKAFWNDFTFVRIDLFINTNNAKQTPWIKWPTSSPASSPDHRREEVELINIKISFDKHNMFHRAYMFSMLPDHTFVATNLTETLVGFM